MPAITVEDTLVLPRVPRPDPATSRARPVRRVVTAHRQLEGAGFTIRRPFPGELSMAESDPFLLLDQVGPQVNSPGEARGAPWHPHRGFETVSYILDGEIAHHDTNGGGGVIAEGDTQWMTAGGGILHDELPTERVYRAGGPSHAVQLWVNLPPALKMTAPRYQSITRDALRLLTSHDGGTLVRDIMGGAALIFRTPENPPVQTTNVSSSSVGGGKLSPNRPPRSRSGSTGAPSRSGVSAWTRSSSRAS